MGVLKLQSSPEKNVADIDAFNCQTKNINHDILRVAS